MNFVLLSIVSCLLIANINYASQKKAWLPSIVTPGKTTMSKAKNLSENTLNEIAANCDWESVETQSITTHSPIRQSENLKALESESEKEKSMQIETNTNSPTSTAQANGQLTLYDILCGCCKDKKKSNN